MGDENVGVVSANSILEKYNGYAMGVAVNVLEEVKISGENRHAILNKLKPEISDPEITIRLMNTDSFKTKNTTNYIAFTNFKNALPLEDSSRRWWVIFCQFNTIQELQQKVKLNLEKEYYPRLFSDLITFGRDFRRIFLDRKISREFLDAKRAPITREMDLIVKTEENSTPGISELREIIEQGADYVTKKVLSSKHLFDRLKAVGEANGDYYDLSPKVKGIMLTKLGFSKSKQYKVNNLTLSVWVKNVFDQNEEKNDQIVKDILKNSAQTYLI